MLLVIVGGYPASVEGMVLVSITMTICCSDFVSATQINIQTVSAVDACTASTATRPSTYP